MAALFGHDEDGHMLSDHVGYAATYRIDSAPTLSAANLDSTAPVRLASGLGL